MLIRNIFKRVSKNFSQYKDNKKLYQQTRVHSYIKKYEALPDHLRITHQDNFDYPLRTKQEILKDLEKNPELPYSIEFTRFYEENRNLADKFQRHVLFSINLEKATFLTKKQKERLIFLIGNNRFDEKKQMLYYKVNYYRDSFDNYRKGMDIMEELYLETLRAPQLIQYSL